MKRQPALDGIRAVAVAMVVCFHGGWGWMRGGYVGVSVFFTLSGFLITRLLLDEHRANGRISLVSFWSRRVRRLLPLSTACLLAVIVLVRLGVYGDVPHLRRDLLGSALQVQNWVQLNGGVTYASLVASASSPLDHFWSLAIEEQFYWCWPLVMLAVVRAKRPALVIAVLAAAFGVVAPFIAVQFGSSAAYLATPARVAEILAGATLAGYVHQRRAPLPARVWLLGVPALVVILVAAVTWPSASGPAYNGALPLFALATTALLVAVQVPSPLSRALSVRPLVQLGAISYGVYLVHWPVMVAMRQSGGPDAARFAAVVALTLIIATVSYIVLELPIRRGSSRTARPLALSALAASLGVVAITQAVIPASAADRFEGKPRIDGLEIASDVVVNTVPLQTTSTTPLDAVTATSSPSTSMQTTPATTQPIVVTDLTLANILVPPRPVRILVVGDSTAWATGDGLGDWANANPAFASVNLAVVPGCGILVTGTIAGSGAEQWVSRCEELLTVLLPTSIANLQPDVVAIMTTFNDVQPRKWDDSSRVLTPLDPAYRARLLKRYREMSDELLARGVPRVVWIKAPADRPDAAKIREPTDPAAVAILHSVIDETVAQLPERVSSLDLVAWLKGARLLDSEAARPDGMHWTRDWAFTLSERFLGPGIVRAALR